MSAGKSAACGSEPHYPDDPERRHHSGTVLRLPVSLRFKLNLQTHSTLREETAKMRESGHAMPEAVTRRPAPPWRCWPVCRMNPCGATTISVI
ncbi:hypothetical protein EIN43_01600 [Enterobacter hormaechei]|uniref:Uncharacterized protein n=1 Tax=Enterobacter hormaechei TaxID=158836 RepID=A0A4Y5ZU15_9ENTR|nr:hypothetical protein EIN43_01600 [Enterobacter hormaechei]